jgi:hypothetical protein
MGVAHSLYALPPSGTSGSFATNGLGAGQANAKPLPYDYNTVTAITAANDGVSLPPSVPGVSLVVLNTGAGPLQVYGLGPDTINGVAAATGVGLPAAQGALFVCMKAGLWFRFMQG